MSDSYYHSNLSGDEIENVLENPVLTVTQSLTTNQKSTARSNIGAIGEPSSPSAGNVLTYSDESWTVAAPHYIPSGGTSGQVLKKNSSTDYDVKWANESGGGGGGGGTSDYEALDNKPQINGEELYGDKNAAAFGLIGAPSSASNGQVLTYNGSTWTASQPVVRSVNGKTGVINLDYADVVAQAPINATGILKGLGSGSVSAATPGVDYQVPMHKGSFQTYTWTQGSGYLTQNITIPGATITANTQVDLLLDENVYSSMTYNGAQSLFVKNNNGTLTLYCMGASSFGTITIQCVYYETVPTSSS